MASNAAETTTTQIAVRETFSLVPRNFAEAKEMAQFIASADLVPKDFRGKPANVLIAIQMGTEIGLSPTQALQNIAVINGRPALWGDAVLALGQSDPDCDDIIETFDDASMTARCEVRRVNKEPLTRTFSQADAKLARLWGKEGPWTQYPKRMLQLRARGFALRDAFSARLKGLQMAEELQDIPREVKNVTPRARPPQQPPREEPLVIDSKSVAESYVPESGEDPAPQTLEDFEQQMADATTEDALREIGKEMNGQLENGDRERAVESYKRRLQELRLQQQRAAQKSPTPIAPWDEEPAPSSETAALTTDEAMERAAAMAAANEAAAAKSGKEWGRDARGNLVRSEPGANG